MVKSVQEVGQRQLKGVAGDSMGHGIMEAKRADASRRVVNSVG